MIAEVYDALIAAGSPEDKARKAAEAVAGYENRFSAVDQHLAKMEGTSTSASPRSRAKLNC